MQNEVVKPLRTKRRKTTYVVHQQNPKDTEELARFDNATDALQYLKSVTDSVVERFLMGYKGEKMIFITKTLI
jgi:hypothetical protein